jgi:hypothetical protein
MSRLDDTTNMILLAGAGVRMDEVEEYVAEGDRFFEKPQTLGSVKSGGAHAKSSGVGRCGVVGKPLFLDICDNLMACEDSPQMTSLVFVLQERDQRFVRRCAPSKNYALWRHKPEPLQVEILKFHLAIILVRELAGTLTFEEFCQLKTVSAAARRGIENLISFTPLVVR